MAVRRRDSADPGRRNLRRVVRNGSKVVRLEPAAAHQRLAGAIADAVPRRADAAAYVMGGGIDTVDGGSTACPSALAPLADLLGVLAVVARRDAIHQPRSRLALGEVLVGQPGGGAQQRAMGAV